MPPVTVPFPPPLSSLPQKGHRDLGNPILTAWAQELIYWSIALPCQSELSCKHKNLSRELMKITNEQGKSEMSDISPLQLCFATNDPIIHLNANKRVGKPTWDAGTIRSVPSREHFDKAPRDNPENQQEQWLPAVPSVWAVLWASHPAPAPWTWELHHIHQAFQSASLNIPKLAEGCHWLRGGELSTTRWLHLPLPRQQPTSTSTNWPAVQTALCELPFSCLY